MATAAVLAVSATSASAAAPSFPRGGLLYRVERAVATERVDFSSDAQTCARYGRCGYSGTVTYTYDFHAGVAGAFRVSRRRIAGFGSFLVGESVTSASVTTAAGTATCTDTVRHRTDGFSFAGTPQRLRVTLHSAGTDDTDYLDTRCAGPREFDLRRARAIPSPTYTLSQLRRKRVVIAAACRCPFSRAGFAGTALWKVRIILRRLHPNLNASAPTPQFTG